MFRLKYILHFCFSVSVLSFAYAKPSLVDIPAEQFVRQGNLNLSEVLLKSEELKGYVFQIFKTNTAFHEINSQNFDLVKFEAYWLNHKESWSLINFNNKEPYIIFNGLAFSNDYKAAVEIFSINGDANIDKIYAEEGSLIAYKKHPRTQSTILYLHSYPCCQSASHSIIEIRLINRKIRTKDKFFLGRDNGDMMGPFFPDSFNYSKENLRLNSEQTLYWSPKKIDALAFIGRAATNAIIGFEQGSFYKHLHTTPDGWHYVLMLNGIKEEESTVIHFSNFKHRPIFGWIAP